MLRTNDKRDKDPIAEHWVEIEVYGDDGCWLFDYSDYMGWKYFGFHRN